MGCVGERGVSDLCRRIICTKFVITYRDQRIAKQRSATYNGGWSSLIILDVRIWTLISLTQVCHGAFTQPMGMAQAGAVVKEDVLSIAPMNELQV